MDNASYHSVRLSSPNSSWQKQEIMDWLSSRDVSYDASDVKVELLKLAQNIIDNSENKYVIDDIAKIAGYNVERLLPCHSNLNPIELVWSNVKICRKEQ